MLGVVGKYDGLLFGDVDGLTEGCFAGAKLGDFELAVVVGSNVGCREGS